MHINERSIKPFHFVLISITSLTVESSKFCASLTQFKDYTIIITVDPVYSERGYSEYPVIVNGFLRTDR